MSTDLLSWGLLSTARINERLIPAIRKPTRSDLLAVASRDKARARDYAAEWEIPRWHGSYAELLGNDGVDVVYISLPNSDHAEWAIRAATVGKHVLCEKPLALTISEVDDMGAAAAANGELLLGSDGMIRLDHPYLNQVGSAANVEVYHGGGAGKTTFGDSTEHLEVERIEYENCNAYADEVNNVEAVLLDDGAATIPVSFSRGNVAAITALHRAAREHCVVEINGA